MFGMLSPAQTKTILSPEQTFPDHVWHRGIIGKQSNHHSRVSIRVDRDECGTFHRVATSTSRGIPWKRNEHLKNESPSGFLVWSPDKWPGRELVQPRGKTVASIVIKIQTLSFSTSCVALGYKGGKSTNSLLLLLGMPIPS